VCSLLTGRKAHDVNISPAAIYGIRFGEGQGQHGFQVLRCTCKKNVSSLALVRVYVAFLSYVCFVDIVKR
jgi:hypothetical protein